MVTQNMTRRIVSLLLCVLMALGSFGVFAFAADDDLVLDYADNFCRGNVDRHTLCVTDINAEKDGKKVVKVTPNPEGEGGSLGINLDAYGLDGKKIDLIKYRYVVIEYYYETPEQRANGPMFFNMMGKTSPFSGHVGAFANEKLEANKWAKATFNIGDLVKAKLKADYDPSAPYLSQVHIYPYGQGVKPTALTANDIMYISTITFTADNPNPDREYNLAFNKGGNGVEGEDIKLTAKGGEEVTIPECTYKFGNNEFAGWFAGSNTSKLYQPGDKYTMPEHDLGFTAMWKMKVETPDVKCLHYPDYYNGVVDGSKFDVVLEAGKATVGGLETIRFVPNPNSEKPDYFGFDGWSYGGAQIDLSQYKYAAIVYYFGTKNDYGEIRPVMRILKSSGNTVTKSLMTEGTPLEYGKWSYSLFDLNEQAQYLTETPNLVQMHILPIGEKRKVTELSADDEVCLSKVVFMKNKPDPKLFAVHTAFISGYSDGTFKPDKTMTRAEACTIITRLLTSENTIKGKYESKFTDVAKGEWYYDNIAYLENKGILASYSGTFEPNKNITRAEFAELVYNMGLAKDTGKTVTFSDVPETHPKYKAVMAAASAGIVGGYADGTFLPDRTITRAQVVKVINNAYGKKVAKTKEIALFDDTPLYTDLAGTHWAYTDIMEASINHGTCEQDDKGELWFFAITPDAKLDYASGNAKVAELDKLEAERIAEIRATKDELADKVTGTKYYVSSSTGNDDNDGKTPETAWKTTAKVSGVAFKKGDGVFFKRGDIFRGGLTTREYTSYGAYGEGAKPIIMLSPENGAGEEKWTLVEGTTDIYKYHIEMNDLGGVVCMDKDGKVVNFMEKVCLYNDANGYYDNAKSYKHYKEILDYIKELPAESGDVCVNGKVSTDVLRYKSDIYVRCAAGNPGKVYASIEFINGGSAVISGRSNVNIDNLALFYGSRHGIGAGTVQNLVITNCEIGYIGGGYQNYGGTTIVRYGNGIEVYGGCDNFVIDNCYVYQCYDAGITNQLQKGGSENYTEQNVKFTNNVLVDSCYNIEYFMGVSDTGLATRLLKNIEYSGNLIRRAGFGWGRGANPSNAANIKGWDHYNMSENFVIKNNVFDRSKGVLLHIGAGTMGWLPALEGNTYIEHQGRNLAQYGQNPTTTFKYNTVTEGTIKDTFGEKNPSVYFLEPEKN